MRLRFFRRRRSPLYAEVKALIDARFETLRKERIDPFAFWNTTSDLAFEGSPRDAALHSLMKGLKEQVLETVNAICELCNSRGLTCKRSLLEARGLIKGHVSSAYSRMSDIDQRLRGRGFPDRAPRLSFRDEISVIHRFVDQFIDGRLAAQPRWTPFVQKARDVGTLAGAVVNVGMLLKLLPFAVIAGLLFKLFGCPPFRSSSVQLVRQGDLDAPKAVGVVGHPSP